MPTILDLSILLTLAISLEMPTYSQLRHDEMARLAARYDLPLSRFEALEGGWSNSSFLIVSPGGSHVFTLFEQASFNNIERIGALLVALHREAFPVPALRPLRGGGHVATHDGKPVLVSHFVEGRVVTSLSEKQLHHLGRTLARLHSFEAPRRIPERHPYEREVLPDVFERNDDFTRWLRRRREDFERARASSLPEGLIHGDLFFDNVLFDGDEIRAVIDFEDACHDSLVLDLGMAVIGLTSSGESLDIKKSRALIAGYESFRRLHDEERAALQVSIVWAAASTAAWRYWKFRLQGLSSKYRARHLGMVALADHVRSLPRGWLTPSS